MLGKILVIMMIISTAGLMWILNFSTPGSAGAAGVLGIFVCLYLLFLSTLSFLMYGVSRVIVRFSRTVAMRKPLETMPLKRAYYYSSVIALAPVVFISMQSVGSLGAYELGLIVLLVTIGCVYVTKRAV